MSDQCDSAAPEVLTAADEAAREQVAAFCRTIDTPDLVDLSARELLAKIHAAFPLDQAGMPEGFRGTHSVSLPREPGDLQLGIWWGGKSWTTIFNVEIQ